MASTNHFRALEAGTYINGLGLPHEKEDKLAIEDSRNSSTPAPETPLQQRTASRFNKMASLRYMLMTLALLGVFIVSLGSAAAVRPKDCHSQTAEEIRFQELLASVSDEALHEVLEEHVSSKYKPGVWRQDRNAMSAVHKADAARATSLVQLARRQNVSMTTEVETVTQPTTSTIVVPPTSTSVPEPSTTEQPSTSETPVTSTDSPTTQAPTVSAESLTHTTASSRASLSETNAETSRTGAESISQTSEPPVSSETSATSEPIESTETSVTSSTDTLTTSQTSTPPTATPTSTRSVASTSSQPTSTEATVSSTEQPTTSTTIRTTTSASLPPTTSKATTVKSTTSIKEETTAPVRSSSTTQEVVFTTVKPDGTRSTITSYTIVPAAAEATAEATAGPTFTPEVQDAATSLSGAGFLGLAVVGLTAVIAAL